MTAFQWFALMSPVVLAAVMAVVGLVEAWLDRRGVERAEKLAASAGGSRFLGTTRRFMPPGE
jgi:hypothetical protein